MKLYDSAISPYASRVRLQLYFKGLQAELVRLPQGGTKTAEFRKINPLEKIPTLDDDGFFLPESSAIGEYLEDTRPTPSLRPADPKLRARMRVVYNIADQYVMTPLYDLFDHIDPSKRQQAVVDEKLVELNKALGDLSHFLDDGKYAVGGSPSLADCALVPVLFFATAVGPAFGMADVFAKAPKIGAYYKGIQADAPVQKLIGELAKGLADYMAGNG